MAEITSSPLARLAELQRAADAAKAKVEETTKVIVQLQKRVATKEQPAADAAQKAFDDLKAEIEAALAGVGQPKKK